MNCPVCSKRTVVLYNEGDDRRRECKVADGGCGLRFSTTEIPKADLDRLKQIEADARALAEKLAA